MESDVEFGGRFWGGFESDGRVCWSVENFAEFEISV
jgi:hypothetical protein